MSNLGNLVATATLDIAPFTSKIGQLKTHTRNLDKSLKNLENGFKGQAKSVSNLTSLYNQTGASIKGYQALLDKQTARYNKIKSEIGDVSTATAEQQRALLNAGNAMTTTASKIEQLETKYNSLGNEIVELNKKLAIENSPFTKFGEKATQFGDRMKNIGQSMSGFGDAMTKGVTTPLVAGAGYAIKAAVDFESAFAGVKKTVNETSNISYQQLSDGIRQMAKELPASAVEIANVAESAGQLGIKSEDILSFTRTMIDMGESTNLSATDAATAIAKIANITGMTSDEYQRFGSSVVALGNNFATTESDIVQMANRLASAGTLAGLTEAEILGLSAAMSSVGIEAEAGGTAMTQTLGAMEKAVVSGGDSLNQFAEVAGMSAEQFASKWKSSPIEAIQSFIKGLGELDKKGESATLKLDEMGLSGIRQSNMLKSLGLASESLASAIGLSTKAWDENSALTEEASKRYETTESKLKMLRNEVTDLAIEFGGPLVDALRSGLEASRPLIAGVADIAKAFSNLDKEQQQTIIKWGMAAHAIGPFFSVLGRGIGVIGSVSKGIGTLSTWLGKLAGTKAAASAISSLGVSAAGATGSVGALSGAVGLLANPVTWGVLLGGAAVVALGHFANKAHEARQRTEEWGASVSKAEAQELQKFQTSIDKANKAMIDFGAGGTKEVENVKKAFSGLADEIDKLADSKLKKDLKIADKLGFSDAEQQRMKDRANSTKEAVQGMADEAIRIYQNAANQHRDITATEREIVKSAQNAMIEEKLALLGHESKEAVAIRKAMNGEIHQLNEEQASKSIKTVAKWLEDENKSFKKSKSELKGLLEDGYINQKEYNQKLEALQATHQAKMEAYEKSYYELRNKLGKSRAGRQLVKQLDAEMEALGMSYEKYQARMRSVAETAAQSSSMVGTYWKGMSAEAEAAVTYWNSLILDPKTGEVKTNAQEEIQKALQAEGGWEAMQLSLKEGRMTTTAKIAVGEALIANGQWEALSPSEKALITNNRPAIEAIMESERMLNQWNALPENVKKLLGENDVFLNSADGARRALETWNMMQPYQKDLIARDLASGDANKAQAAINQLTGKTVDLNGNNFNILQSVLDSNTAINGIQQTNIPNITANDATAPAKATAEANVNSVTQWQPVSLNASDNTGGAVGSAMGSVNSVFQYSPTPITASDNTGGGVGAATASVNSVTQSTPTPISAVDNTAGGVSSAQASVNSVQDRTVTITAVFRKIGEAIGNALGFEKGTNFHQGGPAIVNDQKGPLYRELVTLPTGESFIPQGRDVLLDLPRGSKVLPANKTKQLFPHYANGIGFENTNLASVTSRMRDVSQTEKTTVIQQSESNLSGMMSELIDLLKEYLANNNQSSDNYTFNINQQSGNVDDRAQMTKMFKEMAWYMNQQKGRLGNT